MSGDITHHTAEVNGTELHYAEAGTDGPPVLLVHGFPETWRVFRELIAPLSTDHRVFAVDLRGFGDSGAGDGDYDSATSAQDLHELIETLDLGPVHLTGQDLSGGVVFRLAAEHPESVRSLTAIETGLAGFGAEALADFSHGGAWHIGVVAAPGVPELLLSGREREFIEYAFSQMVASPESLREDDLDEIARTYARPGGFIGSAGLYRSMLSEGDEIRRLAAERPLAMPVLAVGAGTGSFTVDTMRQVASGDVRSVELDGVGHYVALEAPDRLAASLLDFLGSI